MLIGYGEDPVVLVEPEQEVLCATGDGELDYSQAKKWGIPDYNALKTASSVSFASPNSIRVFSLKNSGFSIPE